MADESQLDHLIDPAFRRGDGYNDSAIPAILMPKKKHKGDKQPKPVVLPQTRVERRLSKSQERKLKKLEEDKLKKARRSDLYESLKQTGLSADHLELMRNSGALGGQVTAKEALKRQLKEERAGIAEGNADTSALSKHAKLYTSVADKSSGASDTESDDDAESSDGNLGSSNSSSLPGAGSGSSSGPKKPLSPVEAVAMELEQAAASSASGASSSTVLVDGGDDAAWGDGGGWAAPAPAPAASSVSKSASVTGDTAPVLKNQAKQKHSAVAPVPAASASIVSAPKPAPSSSPASASSSAAAAAVVSPAGSSGGRSALKGGRAAAAAAGGAVAPGAAVGVAKVDQQSSLTSGKRKRAADVQSNGGKAKPRVRWADVAAIDGQGGADAGNGADSDVDEDEDEGGNESGGTLSAPSDDDDEEDEEEEENDSDGDEDDDEDDGEDDSDEDSDDDDGSDDDYSIEEEELDSNHAHSGGGPSHVFGRAARKLGTVDDGDDASGGVIDGEDAEEAHARLYAPSAHSGHSKRLTPAIRRQSKADAVAAVAAASATAAPSSSFAFKVKLPPMTGAASSGSVPAAAPAPSSSSAHDGNSGAAAPAPSSSSAHDGNSGAAAPSSASAAAAAPAATAAAVQVDAYRSSANNVSGSGAKPATVGFSFAVKLPGKASATVAAAAAPASADVSMDGTSGGTTSSSVAAASGSSASDGAVIDAILVEDDDILSRTIALSSKAISNDKSNDDAYTRLAALRERNLKLASQGRTAADLLPKTLGGDGKGKKKTQQGDDGDDGGSEDDENRVTAGAVAKAAATSLGLDTIQQVRTDEERALLRADTADDVRIGMWAADGSRVIKPSSASFTLPQSSFSAYAPVHTPVRNRDPRVQEARLELPVVRMEQEVMETIHNNDIVILCGETGSGKTTQVPQFLYESGYGLTHDLVTTTAAAAAGDGGDSGDASGQQLRAKLLASASSSLAPPPPLYRGLPGLIAVTQPRRVAATAMAARVANELGFKLGPQHDGKGSSSNNSKNGGSSGSGVSHVGYQVRYDTSTVSSKHTRIKFCTDGILLREIQSDLLLRKYSVIVLDEAHERNVNTDVLIGLLSRALPLRNQMAREQAEALRKRLIDDPAYAIPAPGSPDAPLPPLKLIIMSATLRVDDFTGNLRLFPSPPPVIKVDARQYPVTVHFAKETAMEDYVGEAYTKAVKIHTRLPDGGVLIFVTGADEVEDLCAKLRKRFGRDRNAKRRKRAAMAAAAAAAAGGAGPSLAAVASPAAVSAAASPAGSASPALTSKAAPSPSASTSAAPPAAPSSAAAASASKSAAGGFAFDFEPPAVSSASKRQAKPRSNEVVVKKGHEKDEDEDDEKDNAATGGDVDMSATADADAAGNDDEEAADLDGPTPSKGDNEADGDDDEAPVHVLPLYALLPSSQQARVFQPPPPGHRLIIVATNVAETSITLPGIRYVIDPGRVKRRVYDTKSGSSRFEIGWISKASADQRAGRAGRVGPGHAYRLYSSAVFNDVFAKFETPEVERMPIESLVLQLKTIGIDSVSSFPFPSPPPPSSLLAAIRSLVNLGALVPTFRPASKKAHQQLGDGATAEGSIESLASIQSETLTPLGLHLSRLPLHPSLAKMLLLAWQQQKAARAAGDASHPAWNLLSYSLTLIAAMGVQHPFVLPSLASSMSSLSSKGKSSSSSARADKVPSAAGKKDGDDGADDDEDDAVSFAGSEDVDEDLMENDDDDDVNKKSNNKDDDGTGEEDIAAASAADPVAAEAARRAKAKEEKRRLAAIEARNAAHAAHARLRHPLSDGLTLLRAAGAYQYAIASASSSAPSSASAASSAAPLSGRAAGAAFCKSNWLRGKSMREAAALRKQLQWMVADAMGHTHDDDEDEEGGGSRGTPQRNKKQVLPAAAADEADESVRAGDGVDGAAASAAAASSSLSAVAAVGLGGGDEAETAVVTGAGADGDDSDDDEDDVAAEDLASSSELQGINADGTTKKRKREQEAASTAAAAAASKAKAQKRPSNRRMPLPPPSLPTETLLRQIIASGLLERVAKRAPPDQVSLLMAAAGMGKGRAWVPYLPASSHVTADISGAAGGVGSSSVVPATANPALGGAPASAAPSADGHNGQPPTATALFVHPTSTVDEADASLMPAYLCFQEVVIAGRKQRPYLKGVTVVDEAWLHPLAQGTPLSKLSSPLDTPTPAYSASRDCVVCACIPRFGDKGWTLGPVTVPHPLTSREDVDMCVRWFGRALIEGAVAAGLKPFAASSSIAAPPSQITKRAPQKRVMLLVDALMKPPVETELPPQVTSGGAATAITGLRITPVLSASQLAAVWSADPGYLLPEVGQWVQSTEQLVRSWPRIVASFLQLHGYGDEQ